MGVGGVKWETGEDLGVVERRKRERERMKRNERDRKREGTPHTQGRLFLGAIDFGTNLSQEFMGEW